MSTPAGDFRTRSTVAYSSAVLAASRLQSPHRGGSGSDGEDDNKDLAPFRTAQAPSAPNILREERTVLEAAIRDRSFYVASNVAGHLPLPQIEPLLFTTTAPALLRVHFSAFVTGPGAPDWLELNVQVRDVLRQRTVGTSGDTPHEYGSAQGALWDFQVQARLVEPSVFWVSVTWFGGTGFRLSGTTLRADVQYMPEPVLYNIVL